MIRFTEEEFALLTRYAEADSEARKKKNGEKNISAYIRKRIFLNGDHPDGLKKEIKELNYQIRKIGVNINQVAAKVNSGYAVPVDIVNLEHYLMKVEKRLQCLTEKIGESYGDHETDAHRNTDGKPEKRSRPS